MRKKLVFDADGNAHWVEPHLAPRGRERKNEKQVHVSNMAMGCLPNQAEAFEADAKLHGFHVEFHPDRTSLEPDGTPNYMEARIPKGELERYRRHRGLYDKNSKNGSAAMMPEDFLVVAEKLARRSLSTKEGA